jgi:hypothetical protein
MVPVAVKSFFGLYPESCRFFMYISWFLFIPDMAAGGAPIEAYAFLGPA